MLPTSYNYGCIHSKSLYHQTNSIAALQKRPITFSELDLYLDTLVEDLGVTWIDTVYKLQSHVDTETRKWSRGDDVEKAKTFWKTLPHFHVQSLLNSNY